jgi:hypothetical protein
MIYYATYNENGEYTGFYTLQMHGENIPTPNIELTEEQWKEACISSKEGKYKCINGIHTFVRFTEEHFDEMELARIRSERNFLLRNSDWTQIPNNPLTQEKQQEWALYRQKLRDVTNTKPYVLPTEPE